MLFDTRVAVLAAAIALTPAIAESVIAKRCTTCTFVWKSIQIAAPRRASNGEIGAAGLPPNAIVTVVKATFTQKSAPGYARDHVQYYYFFKGDFGGWSSL